MILMRVYKHDFHLIKMSQYFPKPCEAFGGVINVKVIFQIMQHKQTSRFALKTNLANLKPEVDKLDIDKLKPFPNDVSKLSNVVTIVKKVNMIN